MDIRIHKFKFLHYENEWIDGAPYMPYWQIIAHLICELCGYYHKEKVVIGEKACIHPAWPQPNPLSS